MTPTPPHLAGDRHYEHFIRTGVFLPSPPSLMAQAAEKIRSTLRVIKGWIAP